MNEKSAPVVTPDVTASDVPSSGVPSSGDRPNDLFEILLRFADDHLILGHRLSQWCGHAPMLEEDLALPNIALDLIGGARVLYSYAGTVEGKGRDEDALAFLRDGTQFRHILMAEKPNGDFAYTMLRQFFFASFMHPFWDAMRRSSDQLLADHAGKAVKEYAYHVRHCGEWVIRMGDGTEESARRMQDALVALTPYVGELFESDDVYGRMVTAGVVPSLDDIRRRFDDVVARTFAEGLLPPFEPGFGHSGGRYGRHGEDLGFLLAEMQFLQRAYPGQSW